MRWYAVRASQASLPGWSAVASALRASSIAVPALPTSAYGLISALQFLLYVGDGHEVRCQTQQSVRGRDRGLVQAGLNPRPLAQHALGCEAYKARYRRGRLRPIDKPGREFTPVCANRRNLRQRSTFFQVNGSVSVGVRRRGYESRTTNHLPAGRQANNEPRITNNESRTLTAVSQ